MVGSCFALDRDECSVEWPSSCYEFGIDIAVVLSLWETSKSAAVDCSSVVG